MNFSGITGHQKQIERLELLAGQKKIPQTMLFTGPSGIGKRLVAERFLSALFCRDENPPCLHCSVCARIKKETHPDYIRLLPGEKGIIPVGTEEKKEPGTVRWLIDRMSRRSVSGARGILIDGIDRISEEGQNALLKTVEEPAESTRMILIASGKATVLPTIASRSFEIAFHPLSEDETAHTLAALGLPGDAAEIAAVASGGSAGTGLLLGDDETRKLVFGVCGEISRFLNSGDIPALSIEKPLKLLGPDIFLDVLTSIYRRNLLSLLGATGPLLPEIKAVFIDDTQKIQRLIKILLALKKGLSNNLNIRIAFKGMLYSLYSGTPDEIPGPRFDYYISQG